MKCEYTRFLNRHAAFSGPCDVESPPRKSGCMQIGIDSPIRKRPAAGFFMP